MRTKLQHLTEDQEKHLSLFVQKIVKNIAVHKVVCYGIRACDTFNWSALPLHQAQLCPTRIVVDLLVVPDEKEKRSKSELSQLIENMANTHVGCTCIVHTMNTINKAVEDCNLFFNRLYRQAFILYGYEDDWYFDVVTHQTASNYLEQAARVWEQSHKKATQFYQGAGLYIRDFLPEQAVFSLHQAVEQTAIGLMRALTSYRANSHHLPHLLGLLEHVGFYPYRIFPQHSQEEKNLFAILQNSYLASRYKDDYSVSMAAAEKLYSKVTLFMKMAAEAHKHQISVWQEEVDLNTEPPSGGGALGLPLMRPVQKRA